MQLRAVLLAEGKSDRKLIGVLERLCLRYGAERAVIDWGDERLEHFDIGRGVAPRVKKLLELDAGYDVFFVHRDADQRSPEPRLAKISSVFEALDEPRPPHVRVVPVQEMEAWLIVDEVAILEQVGNRKGPRLNLPKPKDIERRADPKALLETALAHAMPRGRSGKSKKLTNDQFGKFRAHLLENLDIDGPVNQLSAWQQLLTDLKAALTSLDR